MTNRSIWNMIRKIPAYMPTAVVLVVILYLTLLPQPLGEEDIHLFEGADKVVHFIMFGGLTGTFIFDRYRISKSLKLKGALFAAVCSTMLGVIIEILQDVMALGRGGNDFWDAAANTLGAFCAVYICYRLHWINVIIDDRS